MTALRTFRKCSILQPGLDEPVRNCGNVWKLFQEAPKIVDLQLGAPTGSNFIQKLSKRCDINKANTGVRLVHITTRFETSQNRPRPKTINTERDESSHTHLTVFTTLRSFRDKHLDFGTSNMILRVPSYSKPYLRPNYFHASHRRPIEYYVSTCTVTTYTARPDHTTACISPLAFTT